MNQKKWILGLDSLRILLAIIVLLSHLDTYSLFHSPTAGQSSKIMGFLFGNSFVGVCAVIAFFVISGIVIHFPYTGAKKLNTSSFLIKRYLRLGIPMLVVYAITKFIDMPISHLPFWSLYCELIYYTLYPIILYAIKKDKKMLLVLFILSFVLSYIIVFYDGNAIHDLFNKNKNLNAEYWQLGIIITAIIGLPNWLLGVVIAQKFAQLTKAINISISRIYLIRFTVFLLSMICSVSRFHFSLSYTLSLNIFGLFAGYWIWMEINYWANRTPNKSLEAYGKISYSVYICHAIAVFLVANAMRAGFFTITIEIIATFAFSYLFYLMVEKPSHRLAQKIT